MICGSSGAKLFSMFYVRTVSSMRFGCEQLNMSSFSSDHNLCWGSSGGQTVQHVFCQNSILHEIWMWTYLPWHNYDHNWFCWFGGQTINMINLVVSSSLHSLYPKSVNTFVLFSGDFDYQRTALSNYLF